ncbi:MAG: hypothetical protein NWE84_02455 [Candidatus Bathyarchaeota archaeon]|nr:hypothetical protein [Candidatus Bathyarchaeota archaeon]
MVAKDILEVLYAPHKVFKRIVQNPGYLGPFILLLIFVLAQVGTSYVTSTRLYIEQTMPVGTEADAWTENSTLWQANPATVISDNNVDFINGSQAIQGFPDYYGNSSIEFAISDNNTLKMSLNDFGSQVNCGANGFRELFFRVKIVTPAIEPENVTLTLYSLNDSFFYYDLASDFSAYVSNVWNNISVPVGSGDWLGNGNPNWENLTGLELQFAWSSSSDIDLRLDSLFFRNSFGTQIELIGGVLPFIANSALNAFAPFLFEWLLLTGLIYLLIKGLKGNVVWRPLMVAVGYALVTMVIQAIVVTVVYTNLPDLYYPLELLAYVPGEFEAARDVLVGQLANINMVEYILQAAIWVWTVALGTFIVRAITGNKKIGEQVSVGKAALESTPSSDTMEFSWMKCLLVSGLSMFLTIIILGFLGVA